MKGEGAEEKKPGALAVRPKTSMIPAGAIVPTPAQEPTSSKSGGETEKDTLQIIKEKVFQINDILKGTAVTANKPTNGGGIQIKFGASEWYSATAVSYTHLTLPTKA